MHTENFTIASKAGRKLNLDCTYLKNGKPKPLVIFAHGFKGFKDWGYWPLMAQKFADEGYLFLKFNFSHNGTSPETPSEFSDLTAFGENTYTKELLDITAVLDWVFAQKSLKKGFDFSKVTLIGHSRGGGIAILAAAKEDRIHNVITWAAVDSLSYFWESNPELLAEWKKKGLHSILNGRTKQEMPLNYTLVEDFEANAAAYSIEKCLADFKKPMCILHGKADAAVHPIAAQNLHLWNSEAEMFLIDGADHVFGGKHPYSESYLPLHAQVLLGRSLRFLEAD